MHTKIMARPYNDQTGVRKISLVGGKSYAVSLPLDIIKQLGWEKGDEVIVRRQSDIIVIQKKVDKPCAE